MMNLMHPATNGPNNCAMMTSTANFNSANLSGINNTACRGTPLIC